MATLSDKELLVERDAKNGVLLRVLACLSVVFVTVFLSVTFLVEITFEKYCAPHNATCPQGLRGDNGTAGLSGSLGSIGATGWPGDKGIIGDIGILGSKGEVGSKGVNGDIGLIGTAGLHGDKGVPGEHGVQGAQGLNGSAGIPGKPGLIGDIGDIGLNGSYGQDGVQGSPGFVGIHGDKGLNGTQGRIGPIGTRSQLTNDCLCYKKPSFFNPRDETIAVTSITDAVLPCESTGNPPPVVTLYKPPRKNGRKRIVEHTGNTYTIVKATSQDYGSYICTATNMYGSVSKTVTVMGTPAVN